MALRLTDTERANIRAALLAMGPERRARLEGQCFSRRYGHGCYLNVARCCALGQAATGDMDEYEKAAGPVMYFKYKAIMGLPDAVAEGLYNIQQANDAGQLRTKAAVRELLALAG